MKRSLTLLFIIFISSVICIYAYESPDTNRTITVRAVHTKEPIIIDGILSEEVWQNAFAIIGLTQLDPNEGKPETERTEVRIAYDDNALYVGARMYDSSPDSIIKNLARRDVSINSDWFEVYLDPFNDKRTGYYFAMNAGGTLYDGTLYNDTWSDQSWDGVWEGKVHVDDKGWTVEMRIPFSQLRFNMKDADVWGIDIQRQIARKHENDYLIYVPKNSNGFVSRFAQLVGIKNINPPSHFEFLPYLTSKAEYSDPGLGNPYNKGSVYTPNIGADLKMGIGTNLTLNATINPDFGQVEIDPAVINLTDVETYFQEKRPFFVEGSSVFNFGRGGVTNYWSFNWWTPTLFYSRRIGRAPQVSIPSYDFIDEPNGTHILGAAKIIGRVDGDWNIGAIQALTKREYADYQTGGQKFTTEAEPFTYYGIVRAQKEFNEGHQGVGFISTYTDRFFRNSTLKDQLNGSALVSGLDGWSYLDTSGTWVINGWYSESYVKGNKTDMLNLQTSSHHYFQRPDSKYVSVDSNATSLTGYSGRIVLSKQKGDWGVNSAFGVLSPGYEINDLGYLPVSDVINMHVASWYQWTKPNNFFRNAQLGGALFRTYDYEGDITWEGLFHNGSLQLLNFYWLNWDYAYNPKTVNIRATRGGPSMINPPGWQVDFNIGTDSQKDLVFSLGSGIYKTSYSEQSYIYGEIDFNPMPNISLSIAPELDKNYDNAQWVNSYSDPYDLSTNGSRYVFAQFHQTTFSAGIRLNWTFTPKLSLQLYVQPLISSGDYRNFKELAKPGTYSFNTYGQGSSTFDNATYTVDPDGAGPAQPFTIDNPDFNFVSLRGNAVLRWEYLPGSVVYFVWTQTRSDQESTGDFQFRNSLNRMWTLHPDNIFIVKFTYWINM
ncbi:MAG: DUF5916 domain-containing protein [Ignavibacteriaceae bacterium]|nr:DUF5916 domain-containing protein [Ignavibacteriaceae bacterium]